MHRRRARGLAFAAVGAFLVAAGPASAQGWGVGAGRGAAGATATGDRSSGADTAQSRSWGIETGISLTGTISSNPDLAPKGQERADILLGVSPTFSLIGTAPGGRLRVSGNGDLGASVNARLRGENRFSLRPQGALNATFEAIDNFLFIDGGLIVQRSLENAFLGDPGGASPVNTFTSVQGRLSPYIQGRLPGSFEYTVRSDNSWTDSSRQQRQYWGRHTALVERAPQPIGVTFSAERSEVDDSEFGDVVFTTDIARLIVRYAPAPQYSIGIRGGWERNNYVLANKGRTFHGFDLGWRPDQRTNLNAFWEDRFFGSGWQLGFTHRRPRVAFNVQSVRDTSSTPQQFLTFPGLANLVALLDAALTTRFPDPVERQRAVRDFLLQQQLPPSLLTPVVVRGLRLSLQASTSASVILLGQRNSLAFSVFHTRTEDLVESGSQMPSTRPLASALNNNVQRGAEIAYSRQMTPITGLTASVSWRDTEGLGDQNDQQTTQKIINLQANTQLGARTSGFVGAKFQWIDSNVTNEAREAALLFGLNHRF